MINNEEFDNYVHVNDNTFYISENISTADTEHLFKEQFIKGCVCSETCWDNSKCKCLENNRRAYECIYQQENMTKKHLQNALILNRNAIKNLPIYECNDSCKCRQFCGNRLVQYGPRSYLEVFQCNVPGKGLGLKSTQAIPKGTFVCEYAGEVLTKEECERRFQFNQRCKLMNYIFCLREHFGEGKVLETFVDPSRFGNIAKYINHSCDPNCAVYPVRVNNSIPKLAIFAIRDIEAEVELTFDYGEDALPEELSQIDLTPCLCLSQNCRKFMPYCISNN